VNALMAKQNALEESKKAEAANAAPAPAAVK
jgi:hypothetical protein